MNLIEVGVATQGIMGCQITGIVVGFPLHRF